MIELPKPERGCGHALGAHSGGTDPVTDWQPIDTAPRDGTQVLLYVPQDTDDEMPSFIAQGWYESGIFDRRWYEAAGECVCDPQPTHWMPLPAPPEQQP